MFDVILLMAGSGTRTGLSYNKMLYKINNRPLFMYSLDTFLSFQECSIVVLVVQANEQKLVQEAISDYDNRRIRIVTGGAKRQDSVAFGMEVCQEELVLIHDGARPLIQREDINRLLEASTNHFACALAIPVTDTIRLNDNDQTTLLDRSLLMAMQTPQAVNRKKYVEALHLSRLQTFYGTDDVQLLDHFLGIKPFLVHGNPQNLKVTTSFDLEIVKQVLKENKMVYKIGHAHDTHRLVTGRPLILGGVTIPYSLGLLGHSDADVVYHVISEAIIGALGLGDLGMHFSDKDPKYLNINSAYFVNEAKKMLENHQYQLSNLDLTIFIEEPHLKDYKDEMKNNIAKLLDVNPSLINVKATRGEGLGFIGQKEGISAECVVLIHKN
ncbi:MAG: 2-C-methyl-D-erythritol 4-phosphate cytidylyltransferase [Bacilli bacterium]